MANLRMQTSAVTNIDIVRTLSELVGYNQFMFVAPVSKVWKRAWGQRPAVTTCVTPDTTVSQLHDSFACGLPRDRVELCAAIARLGNLELLKYAREFKCPWDESTSQAAARHAH